MEERRPRSETIFSVVFNKDTPDRKHGKSKKEKISSLENTGFSRSSGLSVLYGIIVVLIGFVFPMTEALRNIWMDSHFIAVFNTYLFSVGCIFIIYNSISESVWKKKQESGKHKKYDAAIESVPSSPPSYESRKRQPDTEDGSSTYQTTECTANGIENSGYESNNDGIEGDNDREITTVRDFDIHSLPSIEAGEETTDVPQNTNMFDSAYSRRSYGSPSVIHSDDIVEYIAMSSATATHSEGGSTYFLKAGTLLFAIANMVYIALRIEGESRLKRCAETNNLLYPYYVHLPFVILQTYFLLKDTKIACRKRKALARFGLVHLLAVNLCVWLRVLMMEVAEALHLQSEDIPQQSELNFTGNDTNNCGAEPIMFKASPYLFPFILEYSLVAVTTLAFRYSSVSIKVSTELYRAVRRVLQKRKVSKERDNDGQHYHEKQGLFAKSHSGLYLGVLTFAGVIVSMILFLYWKKHDELDKANFCHSITELLLLVLMLVSCIIGLVCFAKYVSDVNQSNTLDHALLLISVSATVVLQLFKFIVYAPKLNESLAITILNFSVQFMEIIQCVLQTVFVIDGMQRVAVKEKHIRDKHGRGVVTFMIVANVAMWIFHSFQEKKSDQNYEEEAYGDVAWTIIHNIALPMMLFFRFHSSICLAHMWHHSFEGYHDPVENTLVF